VNDVFLTANFMVTCAVGIICTLGLWRRYSTIAPTLPGRDRLVLQAFVVIAVACTLAAGYFGVLALRRLLGYEPLDWTGVISYVIAEAILLIPLYIVIIVRAVAEGDSDS
jgi:hypothetical protein